MASYSHKIIQCTYRAESEVQGQHEVSFALSFQGSHCQNTEDVAEGRDCTTMLDLAAGKEQSFCIM